jgi:hypothetical protein
MKNKSCESCLMPFTKDPGKRESDRYCSYCFNNGKLCYEDTDLKVFQQASYDGMVKRGMNKFLARFYTYLIRFAPRWRGADK